MEFGRRTGNIEHTEIPVGISPDRPGDAIVFQMLAYDFMPIADIFFFCPAERHHSELTYEQSYLTPLCFCNDPVK